MIKILYFLLVLVGLNILVWLFNKKVQKVKGGKKKKEVNE